MQVRVTELTSKISYNKSSVESGTEKGPHDTDNQEMISVKTNTSTLYDVPYFTAF